MSTAEIIFAFIVGFISALGVFASGVLMAYSGDRAAKLALKGVERQISLTYAVKIAEFRQQWINDLRDSMAKFQSVGIMADSVNNPEFYRQGTKIELLINRGDVRYDELITRMYAFLSAESEEERWLCNAPFVETCQDILKTEWEVLKRDLAKGQPPSM